MIRTVLVAAVLLSVAGCCSYLRTDACVVDDRSCTTTGMEITWCPESEPEPVVPPVRSDPGPGSWCPVGVLHEGDDCADLGFTRRCPDGSWVRPGTGC